MGKKERRRRIISRVVAEVACVNGLGEPDLDEGAHEALLELVLGEDLGLGRN